MTRTQVIALAAIFALGCTSSLGGGGDDDGSGGGGGNPGAPDAGGSGEAPDAGGVSLSCDDPAELPVDATRPVAIMNGDKLSRVAARLPCVTDPALRALLESPDTMWYDHSSIVPGYQDSFGDNVIAPIGMRPNTIDSGLIDLAVPGGHAQIFSRRGVFHFPFGTPIGSHEDDVVVVDFWQLPRDGGELLPVVWWQRDPNELTHRVNWLFPRGTVFGELLFIAGEDGTWYPFEIRTRTRAIDRWQVDVYRPFPTAADLAAALEAARAADPAFDTAELAALLAHARDDDTLEPATLGATNFASAFAPLEGALDVLPGLSDPALVERLLRETPFRSARDAVWKQSGGLQTYAPSTDAALSIVPRNYNGGLFEVNEDTCDRCHRDAGRPFETWYENIIAYGELWGEDETFTWHPFETDNFVNSSGDVVNFNYDNRVMRQDFLDGGVLVPYDGNAHPDSIYKTIPREWKGYAY